MTYATTTIIEQRKTLLVRLLDLREDRLAALVDERLPVHLYRLAECGQSYDDVWAADATAALEVARGRFDPSSYDFDEGTDWIDIRATNAVDRCDSASDTITVEPKEPECADDHAHDWRSPHSVLGGLRENPGVHGHGGGVIIREVCRHCGCYRVTDTWAQRRDTGEQGLRSIAYEDADDASTAWVYRRRMAEARERLDVEPLVTSYTYDDEDGSIEVPRGDGSAQIAARLRELLPEPEYLIDDSDDETLCVSILGP